MYITLTRKKLFAVFCVVLTAFFVLVQIASVQSAGIDLSTNAKRVEYISTLGIQLESDDYIKKEVIIPQTFGDVYSRYNAMQKQAGFDLTGFCGKKVAVYTYNCTDERVVNLMVYKNKLIGGDVAETSLGGNMTALKGR